MMTSIQHIATIIIYGINNIAKYFRDRVPTVLVKEWPLVCTMFNGDSIMGPVPTLFAENVEVKHNL
jgi:hypothetical protein